MERQVAMVPVDLLVPLEGASGGCYVFWCPGCKCGHAVDEKWTITGTLQKPTIRASVLHQKPKGGSATNKTIRCHLFVTDGQIRFLNDCEHELSGKTVPMEPLP